MTHDSLRYINILTYLLTYFVIINRRDSYKAYMTAIVVNTTKIVKMSVFCFSINVKVIANVNDNVNQRLLK